MITLEKINLSLLNLRENLSIRQLANITVYSIALVTTGIDRPIRQQDTCPGKINNNRHFYFSVSATKSSPTSSGQQT